MADRTPRERVRITKTFVESRNLKPGFYVDEKIDGFRLKVTSAGKKVYLVYGKVRGHSKAITVTIGHHGQPKPLIGADGLPVMGDDGLPRSDGNWTADKAEIEAGRIWGLMKHGANPNEVAKDRVAAGQEKQAKKAGFKKAKEVTLAKAFDDYIKGADLKESTAYVYKCTVRSCPDKLLKSPIVDISEDDMKALHESVSKEHPGHANHLMRILRAVFNYAVGERRYRVDGKPIIASNPVSQWAKGKKSWNKLGERRNIIKNHQFKAYFDACRWLEHPVASDYLQFLLLTGLRAEEAASLQWSQFDWKGRTVHILETKNGRKHQLPITDYLHALLKARWQSKSGDYVFSNGTGGYMSDYRYQIDRVVEKCRELLAASDDEEIQMEAGNFVFMPHDLRRTFGTIASLQLPDYIVKRLLNHVDSNDVTQTHYIHADIESLRKPMQEVNNHILNCAEVTEYGAPTAPAASKVVRFQKMDKKPAKR